MPASEPTILATSGGLRTSQRIRVAFDALVHYAVDLSGVNGRRPKIMYVGTAIGDAEFYGFRMMEAGRVDGFEVTALQLFPMPNLEDVAGAPVRRCLGDGWIGRQPARGVARARA
jgi:hypothetical protein